jgi:sugar phosphate isomerase/epimerase
MTNSTGATVPDMIEISVATSSIDNPESIRYGIEWAIEHGFNGVEFNAPDIYLAEQSLTDLKWASDMSEKHELRYTHHFPPGALPASHVAATRERDFEELTREIFFAGELGVEVIVVHPGRLHVPGIENGNESEEDRLVAMEYFIDWVKDAAPEAEVAGVVLGLENMHYNPGWVVRSHEDLAEIVDSVASPAVGITFDVGHAWGSGGVGAGFEILGDRIAHVQAHDARGKEGAGNVNDQHKEIGTGLIDWTTVGEFVKTRNFVVALETSARLSDREDAAIRSRDVLRSTWS